MWKATTKKPYKLSLIFGSNLCDTRKRDTQKVLELWTLHFIAYGHEAWSESSAAVIALSAELRSSRNFSEEYFQSKTLRIVSSAKSFSVSSWVSNWNLRRSDLIVGDGKIHRNFPQHPTRAWQTEMGSFCDRTHFHESLLRKIFLWPFSLCKAFMWLGCCEARCGESSQFAS